MRFSETSIEKSKALEKEFSVIKDPSEDDLKVKVKQKHAKVCGEKDIAIDKHNVGGLGRCKFIAMRTTRPTVVRERP